MAPIVAEARAAVGEPFAAAVEAHFEEAYDLSFGVGQALAARRHELHLSQKQVAQEAGIDQADISRIENGKSNVTVDTLERVLQVLKLELQLRPAS
jgi:ribosome-binding protein aMBF1 (putative translation factor)